MSEFKNKQEFDEWYSQEKTKYWVNTFLFTGAVALISIVASFISGNTESLGRALGAVIIIGLIYRIATRPEYEYVEEVAHE